MNFESFNLHPTVMAGVRAMRYAAPTLIQSQAIPPALEGRDVIGLARTGTGKTAAFVLPVLQRLRSKVKEGVRALVISPTRELAEPILEVINKLGEKTGLESLALYGGISLQKQLRELRYGPAIVVTCPDRLLNHLWKGSIKLTELEVLVIDEADHLSEMGFLPEIRNILDYIEHKHQTLLFSTAMPDGIRRLVRDCLHDPVTVQVDRPLPEKSAPPTRYRLEQYLKSVLRKNHPR
jgi:ATP-dependent RNA helicase RhlE